MAVGRAVEFFIGPSAHCGMYLASSPLVVTPTVNEKATDRFGLGIPLVFSLSHTGLLLRDSAQAAVVRPAARPLGRLWVCQFGVPSRMD